MITEIFSEEDGELTVSVEGIAGNAILPISITLIEPGVFQPTNSFKGISIGDRVKANKSYFERKGAYLYAEKEQDYIVLQVYSLGDDGYAKLAKNLVEADLGKTFVLTQFLEKTQ